MDDDIEPFAGGHLALSRRQRRVWLGGAPVALGGRAFDLLCVLVDQGDPPWTKRQLIERVWPGRVVEENNLHSQVKALRQALGADTVATVPGRGYRFTLARDRKVTSDDAPGDAPARPAATGASPRLVGRDADLRHAFQWLVPGACVTLAGPAGVGKTALAQHLALATSAPLVDLLPLQDAALLPARVGQALGVSTAGPAPLRALAQGLAERAGGVVLDNAEHLVAEVAALVQAVRAEAPGLWWLVTSQVPLHLADERVMRLSPLALPAGDQGLAEAAASPAVQLLVAEVKRQDGRFELDASNVAQVVWVCRGLDGLPLALRLAAARVPALGLDSVLQQLDRHPARLLSGGPRDAVPRHASLQAALDWSWGLLPGDEQRVLSRLAVLPGPFSLELAAALAAADERDEWSAVEAMATLVDRSLLEVHQLSPMQYRMLDSVRAHALARLRDAGELARVCGQAADLLQQRFAAEGARSPVDLARLSADAGRPAEALKHWLQAADQAGAESRLVEVEHHLTQALAMLRLPPLAGDQATRSRHIELLLRLGSVAGLTRGLAADLTDATYQEVLDLADEEGFGEARFVALFNRLFTTAMRLQDDTVESLLPELEQLADRLDQPRLHLQYEHALYSTVWFYGRVEEALHAAESGYRRYRSVDSAWHCRQFAGHDPGVCAAGHAALTALVLGRVSQSARWASVLEQQLADCSHGPSRVIGSNMLAWSAVWGRDTERARRIAGEWRRHCQRMGTPMYENLAAIHEAWAEAVHDTAADASAVDRVAAAHVRLLSLGVRTPMTAYHLLWIEALSRHGRLDEAFEQAEACAEVIARQRKRLGRPWLLAVRAGLHEQRGQFAMAHDLWSKSLDDARSMGLRLFSLRAALGQARLRRRMGEPDGPGLALELSAFAEADHLPDIDDARAWVTSAQTC